MRRVLHGVFLALLLAMPAIAADRSVAAEPEADVCPAPLLAERGPAIRVVPHLRPEHKRPGIVATEDELVTAPGPVPFGPPAELGLTHARASKVDVRALPQTPPITKERPEAA